MLGENIKKCRKENNISQEELAEKLGVTRQSISLWENEQTTPSIENLVAIANIFNTTTDILLKDTIENKIEETHSTKSNLKKSVKKKVVLVLSIFLTFAIISTIILSLWLQNYKLSAEEIYNIVSPATVEIVIQTKDGQSLGTGFFDDKNGTIITNYHVIECGRDGYVKLKNSNKFEITKILGYDETLDIAIIQIDYNNQSVLTKREGVISVGETVYALGSSVGLTGSFSSGIVSAVDRKIAGNKYIQITTPLSHGNSGGPLVDSYGNVIGITSAGISEGQNLNLAIPIEEINKVSRDKNYTFTQFYNLTDPTREIFDIDDIKVEGTFYIGIDTGEYKGTVHARKCSLVKDILDNWIYNQKNSNFTAIGFSKQDAFDLGYEICSECKCVSKN